MERIGLRKGAFLLLLTLWAAFVTAPDAGAAGTHAHDGIEFTEWTGADSLPTAAGNYCLTQDVTLSSTWSVPGTVNLCLNGHGITKTGSGAFVLINNGATLNLYDCGDTTHYFDVDGNGKAVNVNDVSGAQSFSGGYLTGGNGGYSADSTSWGEGGAVCLWNGTFTMNGGTILGNYAGHGAVMVHDGTFTLNEGKICYNTGSEGSGVSLRRGNGTFVMNGGELSHNAQSAGGVSTIYGYGTVHIDLNGGVIRDNAGWGVDVGGSTPTLSITGNFEITGNMSGGVWTGGAGDIHLSGAPKIQGNYYVQDGANIPRNVYVHNGKHIIVTDTLSSAATIGVTMQNKNGDAFTDGWATYGGETEPASVFSSDNNDYKVAVNNDAELTLVLVDPVTVTFNSNGSSEIASQTIPRNKTAVQPKTPVRAGFIFQGWKSDGTLFDFSAPVTGDITLTAEWLEGVRIEEGFESGALPDGWTTDGNGTWSVGTGDGNGGGAHDGSRNAKITHSNSGNVTYLIMPAQDLSGKTAASLSFGYINRSWSGDIDAFGAYYRIDGGEWQELFATTDAHGRWTEWTGNLPLVSGVEIGFKMTDNYGYGVGLDDVLLETEPVGHSWDYSAADNVITATCQNNVCAFGDSKSFPLTLNAQDGATVAVTLDGLDAFNDATGLTVSASDIVYYDDGGTALSGVPVNVGIYTAKLTVEGVTAEKTFRITIPVSYLDAAWNETTKTVDYTGKEAECVPVASYMTAWGAGWYVVNSDVAISDRVSVTGEVNLILCDGKTLTASKGINVTNGNALNIYGQSADTGKLSASGGAVIGTQTYYGAGIGGGGRGQPNAGGTVTIYGGVVIANGGYASAGISGGYFGVGGVTTIYGGTVTATGGQYGSGIGHGSSDQPGNGGSVTIYGGDVTAKSYNCGAGIGNGTGRTTIYGGMVTATGHWNRAGIECCSGGSVTINGGTVNATGSSEGGKNSAGIGAINGNAGGAITVNDGDVTANGGENAAGIGGGNGGAGGAVTINGGTVTATGGANAAGIGGGNGGAGGTIAISGGTVTATGGTDAAGIGDGASATESGTISLSWTDFGNDSITASSYVGTVTFEKDFVIDGETAVLTAATISSANGKKMVPSPAPKITAQTETLAGWTYGDTVAESAARTLSVTASAATGGELSYQWYIVVPKTESGETSTIIFDDSDSSAAPTEPAGDPISGATGASYAVPDGTGTGAGTYAFYCVVTEEGVANTAASERVSLTVAKATPEVHVTGAELTYNGAAQALVTGSTTGGTLAYCLKGDDYYDPDTETTYPFVPFYEEKIPKGKDAGEYVVLYVVYGDENYNMVEEASVTVTIAPKALTVSGITAENKTYDETTDATLNYDNVTLDGILDGDTLTVTATGTFDSADVGDNKTVMISGLTLSGANVANYELAATGQQSTATANITANELNVTASGYSGTYDGEAHSISVTAPDGVTVTYSETESGTYGDNPSYKDAGSYKVYYKATKVGANTATGSATVTIDRKPVTVSGITADDKPYDGNTNATLNYDNVTFNGIITGDTLTVTATGTFDSADVGDGKTVTISGLTLGGADAGNYEGSLQADLESEAFVTTEGSGGEPYTYTGEHFKIECEDGGDSDGFFLAGVENGAKATISALNGEMIAKLELTRGYYSAEATYATAGERTINGDTIIFTGVDASSVTLSAVGNHVQIKQVIIYYMDSGAEEESVSATATISKRPVTISGIAANDKPYDGNTNATLNYDNVTFNGIITGDTLTVTATGTFESEAVGDGKTVIISDLTLSGADADNYQLAETGQQTETTANITANTFNITAQGYSGVYDGEAHSITVTAPEDVTVTYSETESGTYGDNPSYKDAGSYKVYYKATKVGANTVTDSATVTISKKPVTVSGITADDKPYDGDTDATLNCDNVTFNGIITGDALTVTATGTFENEAVGDGKTVIISDLTLSGADAANYELAKDGQQTETTASITANKLDVTAESYSGTYDGEAHSISVTAPEDVTVTYSETKSGTYGDNPSYTDAGSYTVYYKATKVGANDVTGSATVTISKKPVTVSGITADDKPYDGNTDATLNYDNVIISGIVTGDALTVTATGTFNSADVGDNKTVTISGLTLSGADVANYELAETGQQSTTTANITANELNVTAQGYSGTYDGQSHSITVTAPDGAVITYSDTKNGLYSEASPTYTNAGEYVVYYQVTLTGAAPVSGQAAVSISKKVVSLTWDETSFIYDGAEKLPTVTVSGLLDGDACTVTVTGGQTDVGTYTATAESLSNDNYQLPEQNTVSFTIAPGTLDVTAEGYNGVYDGESHSITLTTPDKAFISYSESADGGYQANNPAYRDAGSYTVYYKAERDGYSTVQGSATITITKREVTVSGIRTGDKPWDGNTDAALIFTDVVFDNILNGDELTLSATGEFEDADTGNGKNVVITNLVLGGADAGNYRLSEAGQQEMTKASITPNALDVTPQGYSGVYDGDAHGVIITVPDGATVTYSNEENGDYYADSPEYIDAGNYAVFYRVELEGSETVTGSVSVNIARKEIRVDGITAESKPYDGNTNVTFNYDNVIFDGLLTGDELRVSAAGAFEDADTGTDKAVIITELTLGGFSAGNYQLADDGQQETTTADITALTLDISAEDWNGVYDGELHSIVVTAPDGAVITYSEAENGAYDTTAPGCRDAGNYTVYYRVTQTGAETVTGTRSVIIERRSVTVSGITADDKPYDGTTEAVLNYSNVTIDGIMDGDTLTVTATGRFEDAEPGDEKTVMISGLTLDGADADNYQLSETGQQSGTAASITANALNVTARGYHGTYDGEAHSITVTAPEDVTVTYSETESGAYGAENPAYRDAGSYTVYYRVTQTGAETITGKQDVIIDKRAVTVSGIRAHDKAYDGTAKATFDYSSVTFNGIMDGDALSVTATGRFEDAEIGDGKTVTISGLTLRGADAENYRLADRGQQSETTANITANALSVTAQGYGGSYDAKPHSITVTAPEDAVITYSETESGVYSTEKPSYTNAGEYTVYYKVTLANYNDVQGYETVSISRASVHMRLTLVDRADPGRTKDSWEYGGIPAVPMLTVEFDETAGTLAVLLGDGETIRDYGMASYSYKIRGQEAWIPSTPEEISVLPAGAYTMRVEIAESRNLPAASTDADFTITKAAHENVLTEAVTLAHGLQNARVDLSAYLEDGFSCAISGTSGNLIAGAATLDESALLFDVSGEAGTLSGSVSVSVSSANYLDYTVTVPLMTGGAFKLRFDSNGGTPVTETRTLNAGNAYGALPVPVRDGYLFDGWYTAKVGGEAVTPDTICNSDATLFAHWAAKQYTVTLFLEGGDLPDAAGIWSGSGDTRAATFRSDGGAVTLPEAVRDGYVFTGWTADNALAKLNVTIPDGNTDNLTYKANWAEGSRSGYASFTKEEGGDSAFLGVQGLTQDTSKNNTQTGGTDNGAKSDIVKALQELACDDDTALASNQKKDVSLSMDVRVLTDATANDNETIRQERQEIADASKEIYGGDSTTKLDYLSIDIEKTVSVTTTEDDGTENVNPGVPVKVTEAHRVIEIPLRYDLTGRYSPVVIRCHATETTAFRRIAERPDVFDGLDGAYYISGAGNDAVIYIYSSRFSSYAVTTSGRESYAVFFDTDGGTEIAPQIVYMDEGGHAQKPADPVKDGYTFRGWRVETNGSQREFDFDAETIRIDTILYADWEKITESEPEPEPVPHISSGGSSTPGLKEYVTAEGYRGVYNGAAYGIRVYAPQESTILYSLDKDGVYTEENPVFRDAGTYTVWYRVSGGTYPTIQDSRQVEITRRAVTVSGIAANHKPYDGTTVATLNVSRAKFKGIVSGDELTITATGTFDNAEIGDNKTVTISALTLGGADAGNYQLAETGQQSETKANITPNDLQVTATGFSGVYDGNAHGISVDAPDGVSVTYSETENGVYHSENPAYVNAGYYIVYYNAERADGVTVTGSAAVEITRRPVTVSGIRANDKPYDENAHAELIYDDVIISGIITGDRLSVVADGTFEDAETGDEKPVFITNLSLRGENVENYKLASGGQQTVTTANITPNVLEVKAEAYVDVYDGELHSIRVEAPEGAAVTYSEQENGTFSETLPVYRDAGQYTVYYRAGKRGYESASGSESVTIYKRPVTVSGISAADKPYDGNTNVSLILSGATLEGQIPGDDITFSVSGAFENAEPGSNKTVFITGLSLRGAEAHNYWIPAGEQQTQTHADITPNLLQVSAEGYTGVYDGQSHGIAVDAPDGTQVQYAESEGGTYRATAPAYRDAGEYTVYYRAEKEGAPAVTGSAVVSIAKREVTVSGITADDKLYDENTGVTLNYDSAVIIGIIAGDKLTVTATGTFESADEGENKTVRLTGLTLGGADVGNYRLAASGQQSSAKASIIRKNYALTGSIRHADADGAVTLELLDGDTVSASGSATMTNGVGTYSFQHVKAGSYTLVVTREDGAQTVKLTMPLKVGG